MPPGLALVLAASQHHEVRDEGHALEHDGEGHEKPDGAPHGAKVAALALTVVAARERVAIIGIVLVGKGGAAAVETIGVAVLDAGGL